MYSIKDYFKKNFNFVICLSIGIIVTSTCMILININSNLQSTSVYNYTSNYYLIANKINYINCSLNNSISDDSINIKAASLLLENGIKDLNECKMSLEKISSNNSISNKLINSINYTNSIYIYCLDYISTSEEISVDNLATNLDSLKDNCIDSYSQLLDEDISINYSSSLGKFLSTFVSHYSKLDQINIQNEIKNKQVSQFITSILNTTNEFSKLLEDLQPAIESIHEENRSFNVLLEDLNSKETTFNSLKRDITNISIPEGYLNYYNSLNDVFTLYSSYLNSIRTSVVYETSSSSYEKNKSIIDRNYTNSYKKYNEVIESFDEFLSLLKDC